MSMMGKFKQILLELKAHLPFTLLGAGTGIVLMLVGRAYLVGYEHTLFAVFHPLHVVFSAMVTAALFELHRKIHNFLIILVVGVVGSIGVATLSDSILPFFGESILGAAIPTHAVLHEHAENGAAMMETDAHAHEDVEMTDDHAHELVQPRLHLGFIEEWYLVFPAAVLGVVLAYFRPTTKLPHAGHVLLSTWASSAHILMNTRADISVMLLTGMFIVLFLSVWLPCCVSDIVFPLLFVRSDGVHVGHSCIFCGKKEATAPGDQCI